MFLPRAFPIAFLFCCVTLTVAVGVPQVDFVEPPSAPPGSGPITLTVHGANFSNSSIVKFDGVQLMPTSRAPGKVTVTVPAASLAAPHTAVITVDGVSNPIAFPIATPSTFVEVAAKSKINAPTERSVPSGIASADFNRDGKPDLAVVRSRDTDTYMCSSGTVEILLGDGLGNFTSSASVPAGDCASAITLGDFNEDGNTDVVAVGTDKTVGVLSGDGSGGLQPTYFSLPVAPGGWAAIVSGDFDADGHLDIVVTGLPAGPFLLLGDGNGHFTLGPTPPGRNGGNTLAMGDFNGDGKLDLAIGYVYSDTIRVLLGDGAGHFTLNPVQVGYSRRRIGTADWNGDGKLDLFMLPAPDNPDQFFAGDGAGNFSAVSSPPVAGESLASGDLNNDGTNDLLIGQYRITFTSPGGFEVNRIPGFPSPAQFSFPALAIADFNGDGRLDFVVGNAVLLQTTHPVPFTFSIDDICAPHSCEASVLSDTGMVAGTNFAVYPDVGFIEFREPDPLLVVEGPGQYSFDPQSINRAGIMAGVSSSSAGSTQASVVLPGSLRRLNLNDVFGWTFGIATYINNRNEVVGYSPGGPGVDYLIPGVSLKYVYALTDSGIVLGEDRTGAVVYKPGVPLYRFPGLKLARAFNSAGQVLAGYELLTPGVGYVFQAWLQGLQPGFTVAGFNEAGQFLGNTPDNTPGLYTAAHGLTLIAAMLPANSGWDVERGIAINNSGQVLVQASKAGRSTALLLTPQ